jgi:predicted MPP superfamily phosphohydrolase
MLEDLFYTLVVLTLVGVPLYAWMVRGRTYAIFSLVILAFSMPGMLIVHARFASWLPGAWVPWLHLAFAVSIATAGLHLTHLVRARLRSRAFRWLVSIPGQTTVAAGAMTGAWLLGLLPVRAVMAALDMQAGLDVLRWLDVLPFVVAGISISTSSRPLTEVVRIRLGDERPTEVTRVPVDRHRGRKPAPLVDPPLRIVQITDPHLGPWQSVRALHRTIDELLDHEPDLVLLTGDFLTMESSGTPGALTGALEPLRRRVGDCYAIFGNHDHEAPAEVRRALEDNGVRLLVDEEALADTHVGPVQIVGADYVGRGRREHLEKLLARFPRRPDHLRLLLLHDPLGFQYMTPGDVDLTLSGHTHGGQVGLVSLGSDWTVLTRSRWPDHGLFGLGSSRLYVHRGTGFYGFPLRVGVPGEASVLELLVD